MLFFFPFLPCLAIVSMLHGIEAMYSLDTQGGGCYLWVALIVFLLGAFVLWGGPFNFGSSREWSVIISLASNTVNEHLRLGLFGSFF